MTATSSPPLGRRSSAGTSPAYIKFKRNHFWLTTWAGGTMLDCRSEVAERFWNGGLALMFRLPRGRFIVGHVLAIDGSLFRGELIDGCDEDEARHHCRMVARNWVELDAEERRTRIGRSLIERTKSSGVRQQQRTPEDFMTWKPPSQSPLALSDDIRQGRTPVPVQIGRRIYSAARYTESQQTSFEDTALCDRRTAAVAQP